MPIAAIAYARFQGNKYPGIPKNQVTRALGFGGQAKRGP
tara:strand:- start:2101 stop:2217 length:117 start_codon:yes stop_codon:yes gene_type:complete